MSPSAIVIRPGHETDYAHLGEPHDFFGIGHYIYKVPTESFVESN